MNIPDGILCSQTHVWVLEEDVNTVAIGLTDFIIKKFGDIVFIELPEVGSKFSKNELFATVETIKVASELYTPISGEVIEINEELINSPELINEEPYDSWLIKIKPDDFQEDIQGLIDYNDYCEEMC